MKRIMKEILWWSLSFIGAGILTISIAKPFESLGGTLLCLAGVCIGFILCSAASMQTSMGKKIINRQ